MDSSLSSLLSYLSQPMNPRPFNQLSPAEAERLAILAEECAEVIQVVGKVLRHGWHPTDHTTGIVYDNRAELEAELGHVRNIAALMDAREDIDEEKVLDAALAKADKWGCYLHHQDEATL